MTVTIADTPRSMLVDTAGAISAVTKKVVDELKLKTIENGWGIQLADGGFTNTLARLPSITIGRLQQTNAHYYVLPTEREFDGLLGSEFLKQYDVDLDFGAGRFNIFLHDHCAGQVVYWPAPAVAVVPFQLDSDDDIRLRVELDGKPINAMLDTGASSTFLTLNDARRHFGVDVNGPDVEKAGELMGSGATTYSRRFKTLAFEGVVVANPMIVMVPDLMNSPGSSYEPESAYLTSRRRTGLPPLILGMSTLSQMHLYIAYKERKLYITAVNPPATVPAAPSPAPTR